jgi:VCBS repeat-containing protein
MRKISINVATGVITVSNPTLLDRESTAAFTVHIRVTDNGLPTKSGTGIVMVQLNDLNELVPKAEADAYETDEDTVLIVEPLGLLANDSRGDATETLSVTAFNGVSQLGVPVTIDVSGGLHYDPRIPALQGIGRGETLTDTITYQLNDGQGSSATEIVTITIQGVNDWHNLAMPLDVNRNNSIEPLDALIIINYLNSEGPGHLPGRVGPPEFYYDTTDDGYVAPLDVLLIFNELNNSLGSGEGEQPATEMADRTRVDLVPSHSTQEEVITWTRLPTDLPHTSQPVGFLSLACFRQPKAPPGQDWRPTRFVDAVFADEEALLDALDDLMLSELVESHQ